MMVIHHVNLQHVQGRGRPLLASNSWIVRRRRASRVGHWTPKGPVELNSSLVLMLGRPKVRRMVHLDGMLTGNLRACLISMMSESEAGHTHRRGDEVLADHD